MMKDKFTDSYFNKAYKSYIVKELSEFGFQKYKSRYIARVVNDSIFQFIGYQKDAHGSKRFVVDIGFRPLYVPHEFLVLTPGARLDKFINQTGTWWGFETEIEAEDSFNEVSQILKEKVIGVFDNLNSTKGLIKYYNTEEFPIRWFSDPSHGFYCLAYLYLKEHRFEEAIDNFINASELYKSYGFDWSEEKYKECEEVLKLCREDRDKVDWYLEKCEQQSLEVLKIDKNKYFYNQK